MILVSTPRIRGGHRISASGVRDFLGTQKSLNRNNKFEGVLIWAQDHGGVARGANIFVVLV